MFYNGLPLDLTATPVTVSDIPGSWPVPGTAMWTWDTNDDADYTPQGITSFRDAGTGQDVVLVSWHSPENSLKLPRLSYLMRDGTVWRYGNVLLQGRDAPPELHAGGLAFFANRVLVADTHRGLLAFDATQPTRSPQSDGAWSIAQYKLFELKDQIPNEAQRIFSFTDIDWSTASPVLLTGAYATSKKGLPGLFAWTLGDDGPLIQPPTDCLPCAADQAKSFRYMQGATRRNGTWYISQSAKVAAITPFAGPPCKVPPGKPLAECTLGLEDLHIPADGHCLRGLTENASNEQKQHPRLLLEIPL